MTIEAIKDILVDGGGLFLILATVVQISPLKINPWTWLGKTIGRVINGELSDKVNEIAKEVQKLRADCDEREAVSARVRILRFGDEIYQGVQHSKDHFDQILQDISEYERYCIAHPGFKNNMTGMTIACIKRTYATCINEHKFL